jgi:trans-2,3-dihydro-3-hydroxyanthranilate isomerase
MKRRFFVTEVFAESNYSGNQLATIIDTDGLDTAEMQQIARAFNFAETTFYLGGSEAAGFDVRIFTPATELPFAGHPTLGTAYLIREHIVRFSTPDLILNLGVGPIPVKFAPDGVIWMRQNAPEFGPEIDPEVAAKMLGLEVSQLDDEYSPQVVSTGLPFLIVPLKDLAALKQARPISGVSDHGILAFSNEPYRSTHDISARMFAPDLGVGEDAATGSANGCLAAFLAEHSYTGGGAVDVAVGQGFEIGRPSKLHLRANRQENFIVEVGGQVNLVAQGDWLL